MSVYERPTHRVPVWTVLALLCAVVGVILGSWLLLVPQLTPFIAVPLIAGNAFVGVTAWRWRR